MGCDRCQQKLPRDRTEPGVNCARASRRRARHGICSIQWQTSVKPCNSCHGAIMLMTLAIVLLVLWLLGLVSAYTMGGFIHVLLVIAIVLFLVQVIQGRKIA
jgi:hypothetical protein